MACPYSANSLISLVRNLPSADWLLWPPTFARDDPLTSCVMIGQFDRREAKSRQKPGLPLAAWGVSRRGTRRPSRRPGAATRCAGRGPGRAPRPGQGGSGKPLARRESRAAGPCGTPGWAATGVIWENLQYVRFSNKYGWLLFARSAAFSCALKANLIQKVSYLFIQGWQRKRSSGVGGRFHSISFEKPDSRRTATHNGRTPCKRRTGLWALSLLTRKRASGPQNVKQCALSRKIKCTAVKIHSGCGHYIPHSNTENRLRALSIYLTSLVSAALRWRHANVRTTWHFYTFTSWGFQSITLPSSHWCFTFSFRSEEPNPTRNPSESHFCFICTETVTVALLW